MFVLRIVFSYLWHLTHSACTGQQNMMGRVIRYRV